MCLGYFCAELNKTISSVLTNFSSIIYRSCCNGFAWFSFGFPFGAALSIFGFIVNVSWISVLSWTKQFHLSWRISLQSSTAPAPTVLLFLFLLQLSMPCLSLFWPLLLDFLSKKKTSYCLVSLWLPFGLALTSYICLGPLCVLSHPSEACLGPFCLSCALSPSEAWWYVLDLSVLGWTQQIDLQWCFSSCFYTPIIDACISLGFFAWFSLVSPFRLRFLIFNVDGRFEN